MSEPVYLGIDLGTQSVRVMAVSVNGSVVAMSTRRLESKRDGVRHEQEPQVWWASTVECLREVRVSLGNERKIEGIAVDSTSGTIVVVDAKMRPITNALMYDDGRAAAEAAEVNEAGDALWKSMSYRMQPSWALPKVLWLLRHTDIPIDAHLVHQNDFVNAHLAGRILPADSSHALKTGYDLIHMEWPVSVLDALRVPVALLPEVVIPGTKIGEVSEAAANETGVPSGVPIFAGMTDGCAAQIASGATKVGCWNTVIGTTLVVKGVTRELLHDPHGVVYSHRSADGLWLPGGASSTGGAAIAKEFDGDDLDWLNKCAVSVEPTPLVVYPLTSTGERFPFVASGATGFTLGIATSTEERYRGVLQGIAMLERLSFDLLRQMGAPAPEQFTISGGAVRSDALNQIRADILERELAVPVVTEGAFGMAVLAASASSSLKEATQRMVRIDRTIPPKHSFSKYAKQYDSLIDEFDRRGWLPAELRMAAKEGVCH